MSDSGQSIVDQVLNGTGSSGTAPDGTAAGPPNPDGTPQPPKKPNIFKRLFGGGDKPTSPTTPPQ
jgi:hypothetical protein